MRQMALTLTLARKLPGDSGMLLIPASTGSRA